MSTDGWLWLFVVLFLLQPIILFIPMAMWVHVQRKRDHRELRAYQWNQTRPIEEVSRDLSSTRRRKGR